MAKEKTAKLSKRNMTEQEIIELFSRAFGVFPVGISISHEGKPYFNSLGLQIARQQFPGVARIIETGFLKAYQTFGETAIAYAKGSRFLETKDGKFVEDTVTEVGTASSGNMSMAKDYPNEMAMTRAINRFLRPAILPRLFNVFYDNVKNKVVTDEEAELVKSFLDFGKTTLEEMKDGEQPEARKAGFPSFDDMQIIMPFLKRIAEAKTKEDLEGVSVDLQPISKDLNDAQKEQIRQSFAKAKEKIGGE